MAAPEGRHQGGDLGLADPDGTGESLLRGAGRLHETGKVMADMALDILGEEGGKFAILSASPDAANQNAWIAAMEKMLEGSEVRQTRTARYRLRR